MSHTFVTSVWPWDSILKSYFHQDFVTGQESLAFDIGITYIWHRSVSPWDKSLCTFMTSVWPWPLTYMWMVRVSFVSFTQVFNLLHVILKGYQPLRTMPQIHVCITFINKENVSAAWINAELLSSFDMKMTSFYTNTHTTFISSWMFFTFSFIFK